MKFFDKLYDLIAGLGKMPKVIVVGLIKKIVSLFKGVLKLNKKTFSFGNFFKKVIIVVTIAAIIGSIFIITGKNSNKVKAIEIKVDGKSVGYVSSQTESDTAKAYALKVLGSKDFEKITEDNVKIKACNIKSAVAVSEEIIDTLGTDLIPVYEVYIDNEFICAVEDALAARDAINNIYELAQNLYAQSTVSFAQSVTLISSKYSPDNENIFTIEMLQNVLSTKLQILHTECEKQYADTDFETVEVQTNRLFMGDSRIRRPGAKGSEYNINLVTYIDNQKVYSEELMSISVTPPTSQIVERGIRAESLSMGTYTVMGTTGMFCWPVVDLFTVTSPYGHRSLGYHRGIDISGANASGKLVVAGASGTVTEAGWSTGGYGNYVKIDHGNGVETLYAHMLDNSIMVNVGDQVLKGQTIGRVGNTGYSFGAHLHFEVRVNGNRLNPAPFLGLQ